MPTIVWSSLPSSIVRNILTVRATFDEPLTGFTVGDLRVRRADNTSYTPTATNTTIVLIDATNNVYEIEIDVVDLLGSQSGQFRIRLRRNQVHFETSDVDGPASAADSSLFSINTIVSGYRVAVYAKNWKTQRGTDGTLARTLTHATRISVRRNLNQAERISFSVPRGSDDAAAIEIGRVVRILDGTTIIASGIVVGPLDTTQILIPIVALGKAEILNWQITPHEFQLESDTAAGQVEELLKNYRFFRQNTESQFNDGTHSDTEVTTVANDVNPDQDDIYITLTQNAAEEYAATGTYISQPILCTDDSLGDPNDITRLRYRAEVGNATDIQVSFRSSNAAVGATTHSWGGWSTDYEADTQSREKLGITDYSIAAAFRWIQVRFTLTTSDDTISPALQAFEVICEYDGEISVGTLNLDGANYLRNPSFESHLRAIQQIVAARNAELRVNDDYELDISTRFGVTTPTVTFTVGSNCNVVQYELDDRRLSTELWSVGATGEGITQEFETTASDSAVETYGSRPWLYSPVSETTADKDQEITDELDLRDKPTQRVVVDELSATALSIALGDLVNFEYAARSIDTQMRVIEIRQADPRAGTPRQFELVRDEGFFFAASALPAAESGDEGASGAEVAVDTLSWDPIPPLSVFVDADGNFSGTILSDVDDYLDNPSGADITYSIASKSSAINSATLSVDNDLSVSITGVVGNSLNNTVNVQAEGEIDGTDRTVDFTVNIDLIYSTASDAEAGATGTTGATGEAGVSGESGATGVSGESGTTGESGESGASGESGVSGVSGESGESGATGESGASGESGTTGTTGVGVTGETGVSGVSGESGVFGNRRHRRQ